MFAFKITNWGTAADRFKPMWVISSDGQIDVNGTKFEVHEFDDHVMLSRRGDHVKVQTSEWFRIHTDEAHKELESCRMEFEYRITQYNRGFYSNTVASLDTWRNFFKHEDRLICPQRVFWLPPLPDLVVARVVRCFIG